MDSTELEDHFLALLGVNQMKTGRATMDLSRDDDV